MFVQVDELASRNCEGCDAVFNAGIVPQVEVDFVNEHCVCDVQIPLSAICLAIVPARVYGLKFRIQTD